MSKVRIAVAALSMSAAAFVGLVAHEGYRDKAYIPVPGDRPTLGHGSTTHADGRPVKLGDTTTPTKALARTMMDVDKFQGAMRQCVRVPLYQHEYDSLVQFAYNIGSDALCKSTLMRKLNAGDYEGACNEMTKWVYAGGRKVQGLVNRREAERKLCLGGT